MEKKVGFKECYECGLIRHDGERKCSLCGSKRVRRIGGNVLESELEKRIMKSRKKVLQKMLQECE